MNFTQQPELLYIFMPHVVSQWRLVWKWTLCSHSASCSRSCSIHLWPCEGATFSLPRWWCGVAPCVDPAQTSNCTLARGNPSHSIFWTVLVINLGKVQMDAHSWDPESFHHQSLSPVDVRMHPVLMNHISLNFFNRSSCKTALKPSKFSKTVFLLWLEERQTGNSRTLTWIWSKDRWT